MAGAKPTPPHNTPNQQLAQYAWCDRAPMAMYGHNLTVEIRAPPDEGGNPALIKRRQVLNDTGSNVQAVWVEDWDALRVPGMFDMPGMVTSATGGGPKLNVEWELRIVKRVLAQDAQGNMVEHYQPLTHWFGERCILVPHPQTLLSGETMRNFLYFATQPGNDRLLVSQRKQAIVDGLDASLAVDHPR
ncbi:hypothetical protein KVR01_004253 [Diaporthe batatas]|uniref:uncharacterized protein n=1 Tax=Diaporthe batatas TaxID=748121 RepID=UPI001D041596|nr:uncharacterized protein KVR01_004253 [Diaporthe batatas]KAG8165701.1 hypothetical protein KVR01_004253 [Diaporthe batatas]